VAIAALSAEKVGSHRKFGIDLSYACQAAGGDVLHDEAEW
jgi:hypothetical protein